MTKLIGYSVVEIETGNEIAYGGGLPMSPSPPGKPMGRIATFRRVGQEADGFRCVERYTVEQPSRHYTKGTTSISFDGDKVIVDPNWAFVGLSVSVTKAKTAIKDKAGELIVAVLPEWKQRNLTAQAVQLAIKGQANWTAEDQAAFDAGNTLWKWVAATRAHSDTLEAEIDAIAAGQGTDEEKAAFIVAWQDHDWPVL